MIKNQVDLILLLASAYHFIAGSFVLGPKSWAKFFAKNTYRLNIPDLYEPRYEVTLRFLGILAVSFSILLFMILNHGDLILKRYSLYLLSFLFIGRAYLRFHLRQTILDAYQLDFKKSFINIVFNIAIGIITLIFAYLSMKGSI